jgi:hypothetical protein
MFARCAAGTTIGQASINTFNWGHRLCIAAIVGGVVRVFGIEIPVLASQKRQVLVANGGGIYGLGQSVCPR